MESTQWFYLKNGQQRGPVDTGDLASLIHSGVLPPDTLVFTSAQADWVPANTTGVFPLKATTLTVGSNTSRKINIAMVILLLVILGGGLIVLQQKQSPDKSNNGRTTLNENDQVRGKFQFDAAKHQNASLETEQSAAEKLAQRYKSNIAAAERKVATARKNESRNDDQLAKANIARLQLEQLLEESRQHNAKMNRQIKTLENQSQLGNMTNDDLAEANEMRRQLEERLVAASQLNANLEQRFKQMEANVQQDALNNAGLTAQLRKASEELETAQQKISSLEQRLEGASPPTTKTPKLNRPQRIPIVPVNAVGNISYVNTLSKFIGINRGSDNGINSGDAFSIISRSTGEFLGRITITKIRPSFAGGTLNGQGIDRLQAGDLLFR